MRTPFTTVIAPVDDATMRDGRGEVFDGAAWSALRLPAPLFSKHDNAGAGHDGGVLIGYADTVDVVDGYITGAGYLLDGDDDPPRLRPYIDEAKQLIAAGLLAPSFDASILDYDTAADRVIAADLQGITLVTMPAFPNTSITLHTDDTGADVTADDVALIAAVNRTGWDTLPVAPRTTEWDSAAAASRVAAHCGVDDLDGESGDDATSAAYTCYARAFLHRDDDANADTRGAYGFGIADIIDGELTIVPAGVFAAAAALGGARSEPNLTSDERDAMRQTLTGIYAHMSDALDEEYTPPWADDAAVQAIVAAHAAVTHEPAPADAFATPDLGGYSPGYRIDGRRIVGHLTHREACHRNWAATCVTPPASASAYGLARRYALDTSAGPLDVARITTGLGAYGTGCDCHDAAVIDDHYCPGDRNAAAAIAHHDGMHTIADVVIGEDGTGAVWVAGVLRDDLPPGTDDILRRRTWSGDWRPVGLGAELVEILALSHTQPGFAHRTRHSASTFTLIAASGPAEPDDAAALFAGGLVPAETVRDAVRAELAARDARARLAESIARVDLVGLTGN